MLKFVGVETGVVDSGYRGNNGVALYNHSQKLHKIDVGDSIAQVVKVSELSPTERGYEWIRIYNVKYFSED